MNKPFITYLLFLLLTTACSSSKETVSLHSIPNYEPASTPSMLFMTFEITKKRKKETARLVQIMAANGKIKNLEEHIHSPVMIRSVVHYKDGRPSAISQHTHPLNRSVEIPDEDHTLSKTTLTAQKGSLTIRMPSDPAMETLELFSVSPDRPPKRILNLKFEP